MSLERSQNNSHAPLLLLNPIKLETAKAAPEEIEQEESRDVIRIPMRRSNYRKLKPDVTHALNESEIDRLFEEISAHLAGESSGQKRIIA